MATFMYIAIAFYLKQSCVSKFIYTNTYYKVKLYTYNYIIQSLCCCRFTRSLTLKRLLYLFPILFEILPMAMCLVLTVMLLIQFGRAHAKTKDLVNQ